VDGLLGFYILFYVLLTAWAIRTETSLGSPRWKVAAGTVAAGVGAAGMILYWRGAVTREIAALWRVVFPCLVAHTLVEAFWSLRHGRARVDPEGELSARNARRLVLTSFLAGLVTLAPYFYINYLVAFG
jgi:hypothetical protein